MRLYRIRLDVIGIKSPDHVYIFIKAINIRDALLGMGKRPVLVAGEIYPEWKSAGACIVESATGSPTLPIYASETAQTSPYLLGIIKPSPADIGKLIRQRNHG